MCVEQRIIKGASLCFHLNEDFMLTVILDTMKREGELAYGAP